MSESARQPQAQVGGAWFSLLLVLLQVLVSSCGGAAASGCQTACDCKQPPAGSCTANRIAEWVCSAAMTCELSCKAPCSTLPYTCAEGESCDGTHCSERTSCPK